VDGEVDGDADRDGGGGVLIRLWLPRTTTVISGSDQGCSSSIDREKKDLQITFIDTDRSSIYHLPPKAPPNASPQHPSINTAFIYSLTTSHMTQP